MTDVGADGRDGRFWLAGAPESRVAGELDLSGEWPVVNLDAELMPAGEYDEEYRASDDAFVTVWRPTSPGGDLPATVHGELRDGQPVTLVDALTVDRRGSAQTMRAPYALLGSHLDATTCFAAARLRPRHLEAWAAGARAVQQVGLRHMPGRLELVSTPSDEEGDEPAASAPEFRVADMRPAVIGELWPLCDGLTALLTLAVDAPAPLTSLWLQAASSTEWVEVIGPRREPTATARLVRPRDVLLPHGPLTLDHVATWLSRYDQLRPIPELVAAAVDSPRRELEAQLLALCTAAEGLHRRLELPQQISAVTKDEAKVMLAAAVAAVGDNTTAIAKAREALSNVRSVSYADRLRALIEWAPMGMTGYSLEPEYQPGLDEPLEGEDAWISLVGMTRNRFAHRLLAKGRRLTLEEQQALFFSLRWFMTALVLQESGVDPIILRRRIVDHEGYRAIKWQLHAWLPNIFGPWS